MNKSPFESAGAAPTYSKNPNPSTSGSFVNNSSAQGQNALLTSGKLEVQDELSARLQRESDDSELERFKDKTLFILSICVFSTVFIICIVVIFSPNSSPENKELLSRVFTGLIGGLIGYLFAKPKR